MISPSNRVRIFVATEPAGFRKGHNGLAALVQSYLHKDPFTGTVYVFRAKRLEKLLADFKRALFGAKSEKINPEQYELALESIETAMAIIHAEDEAIDPAKSNSTPRKSGDNFVGDAAIITYVYGCPMIIEPLALHLNR